MASDPNHSSQKERELRQFRNFCQACGALAEEWPIEQPAEPEPDVIVRYPEGYIGIELTEIHPSGLQKRPQESEQESLLEAAKRRYAQTGLPPVHVFVDWAQSPRISKRTRGASAELLCDLVIQHRPVGDEQSRDVGDGDGLIHSALPIREISVARASSPQAAEWREWNFHEVVPPDPADLQGRLSKEEYKIDLSKRPYDSRWLVLVAGAGGPSTWTVLGASLDGQEFASRYDRVFLFLMDRRVCKELRVLRSR